MLAQLQHIVKVSAYPNVFVQVIPTRKGYYAGLDGGFMIAKFDGEEVAYQDATYKGEVLEDPQEVTAVTRNWQNAQSSALSENESIELINKAAEEWKQWTGESLAIAAMVRTLVWK